MPVFLGIWKNAILGDDWFVESEEGKMSFLYFTLYHMGFVFIWDIIFG